MGRLLLVGATSPMDTGRGALTLEWGAGGAEGSARLTWTLRAPTRVSWEGRSLWTWADPPPAGQLPAGGGASGQAVSPGGPVAKAPMPRPRQVRPCADGAGGGARAQGASRGSAVG